MVTYQKALIANTDLSSSQVFTFQLADANLAVILSGKADNVFLSIKQTMLELETSIKEFHGPVSSLFVYLSQTLHQHIAYLSEFELLLAAWTSDVLYLQRSGASESPHLLPQAYLLRGDHLEPLPFSSQNQLVSGYIKPGDRVLLASSGLLTLLNTTTNSSEAITLLTSAPKDTLQDVLSSLSLDQENEPPVALLQLEVATPPIGTPDFEPSYSNPTAHRPKKGLPVFRPSRKLLPLLIAVILVATLSFIAFRFFQKSPASPAPTPPTVSPSPTEPSNVYQITDWPVLVSLNLLKDKFAPTSLSFASPKLLLLDDQQKSLISFDLAQKNPTVLGGQKQLQDPKFTSTNGEYAFSFSPSKGVVRISLKTQKDTLATPKAPEWGTIVDIYAFGSNFYLLDSGKSNVWKYTPTEAGYSNPQTYFKEGVVTAFADARKLQIDSSVWILKGVNEILKYTSGSQDFYGFSDFPENLKTISSFFVSQDTENVYLLDKDSSAVFVTTKTGIFVALYKGDKLKDVSDIFVDETAKTLYLIDSEKIYQIPLH